MKKQLIISFIVLCITCVNIFAVGDFTDHKNNNNHESCILLGHDHHHMHHGIEHAHGHNHKINLVDFHAALNSNLSASPIDYEKPLYIKQWLVEAHTLQLLRPPIS